MGAGMAECYRAVPTPDAAFDYAGGMTLLTGKPVRPSGSDACAEHDDTPLLATRHAR